MSHPVWQRRLMLSAKIALAGALLGWLASSDRLQLSRLAKVPLNWQLLTLFALVAGSMIIPAVRWWWLLRIQGLQEPLWHVVKLTWSGYLAALVLPGAASGDLAKTYLILRQRDGGRARAFSTILADRFLGLHSLFCLGACSILWIAAKGELSDGAFEAFAAATLIPLTAMSVSLAALLWCRTRTMLFRIIPVAWREAWDESFTLYYTKLPQLFGCFCLSVCSSAMTVGSLAVAGSLLDEVVPLDAAFLAGPLIVVSNCLPITPGGIGLAEAVSSNVFGRLGSASGAEIMVLTRICVAIVSILGLLPFIALRSSRKELETRFPPTPNVAGVAISSSPLLTRGRLQTSIEKSE